MLYVLPMKETVIPSYSQGVDSDAFKLLSLVSEAFSAKIVGTVRYLTLTPACPTNAANGSQAFTLKR